MSCSFSN
jgi:adenosylhomocysteinase